MVFAIPLALLGATLVILLAVPEGTPLLGLDHASFAAPRSPSRSSSGWRLPARGALARRGSCA